MFKKLIGIPDSRVPAHVKITNGSLDEGDNSSSGLVLNGRLDPATFRFLKIDKEYQRPLSDREDIYSALRDGKVLPNVEIGVRGQDFTTDGDDYLINSEAYIIDGYQRIGNAKRIMDMIPGHPVRLFATVHFETNREWEEERFNALNFNRVKISANLRLRNMRHRNDAILTLFGLCNSDASFAFRNKVCWAQNILRGELVTALVMCKAVLTLHGHIASFHGVSADELAESLGRAVQVVSLQNFRRNVSTFFSVVNECWPVADIEYRRTAPQIKGSFLFELARMFSRHPIFWVNNDRQFVVSADNRRKLATFPLRDPTIMSLAGSGGAARTILYDHFVNHMNSGRRTQRLQTRDIREDAETEAVE